MRGDQDNLMPEVVQEWLREEFEIREQDMPGEVFAWLAANPLLLFLWKINQALGMVGYDVQRLAREVGALREHLGGPSSRGI